MTTAQQHLERPVSFVRAAKKLAAIRGDRGTGGGWIRDKHGRIVCQGWNVYGDRMLRAGLIAQDAEHDGGNGKWYVWVIGLSAAELATAEALYGRKPKMTYMVLTLNSDGSWGPFASLDAAIEVADQGTDYARYVEDRDGRVVWDSQVDGEQTTSSERKLEVAS